MLAQNAPIMKPRGIGELFDQAIRLYRNNFLKFIGIIAVVQIPIQSINLLISVLTYGSMMEGLLGASAPSGQEFPWAINQAGPGMAGTLIVSILNFFLVQGFAVAALTHAITDSFLGEEIGIEKSYRKIGGGWKPLLIAYILLALLNIGLVIWTMVPCIGWLSGAGMLIFTSMVLTLLIAPIVVIEKRPGSQAIRRAWDLARKRFWWMTGYALLLSLFSLLIIQGPVAIINMVFTSQVQASLDPTKIYTYQMIIQTLTALALSLLYQPLQSACAIMAYFDLRVRLEGFDLAMMANQSAESPLEAREVASLAPAAEATSLVTWQEMGYFTLFSLAGVLLYFLLVFGFAMLFMLTSGL